jgi:signal transduction histidine kinase
VRIRLSHLAVLLALTMVVTAVAGVVATYREAGDELRDVLDDDLDSQARLLARLLEAEGSRLSGGDLTGLLRTTFRPDEEDTLWVTVYDTADGSFASNLAHDLPLEEPRNGQLRLKHGGHAWEGFQRREGTLVVQLLRRADRYGEVGEEILEEITLPVLVGSAVNLALLAGLIGLSSWPITRLAREIESRNADSLAPVALPTLAAEIAVLRDTLNGMMASVDTALKRERQFASDVAHELRTPLTTLKLELAGDELDRDALRNEVNRLARLVEQLLILARLEQGRWQSAFAPVELHTLYQREIERFGTRVQRAGMTLRSELDPVTISGEATLLQALLQNLLNNVLRHCPPGTSVVVRLRRAAGVAVLEVVDTGPGIPEGQRRQLHQGFTRFDSRSEGLGIGLAICQRIAQVHGATLEFLANDDAPGLRVRVTFVQ